VIKAETEHTHSKIVTAPIVPEAQAKRLDIKAA
jgi:hypothetical protein